MIFVFFNSFFYKVCKSILENAMFIQMLSDKFDIDIQVKYITQYSFNIKKNLNINILIPKSL